ncbi:hypothetical protein TcWFU_002120 [Taenia crassiceps]|uniref:RRM domain-containing protein n=1 Tax=Taenia crassiceps TaxID=6207 RepID=A0ABR4PZA3_9CEST
MERLSAPILYHLRRQIQSKLLILCHQCFCRVCVQCSEEQRIVRKVHKPRLLGYLQQGAYTERCTVRDWRTKESKDYGFVAFAEVARSTRQQGHCLHLIKGVPIHVRVFKLTKTKKDKLAIPSPARGERAEDV